MADIATINIDKKTIESIVERQMQAAIVGQLDVVKDDLLASMVTGLLNSRVKDNGEITNDSWYKTTLLEYLAKEKIKEMARKAIDTFFDTQMDWVEKEVSKSLMKERSKFAKMATMAMADTFKNHYQWNVKIAIDEKESK